MKHMKNMSSDGLTEKKKTVRSQIDLIRDDDKRNY